ncbi:MAG TPA: carboxylating nicotinate-nucleotide diphosphorylase [Bacteroidales bacterium]|nr:carboxylating nicotinate-nucleotide diphosphorylase [Bacteroidales bacterium]HPS63540.1 carboxylating nicotinate-nucleotide diphosphorylase [Bacteroidales bacterium]
MNIEEIITRALEEDTGDGDHTSLATIPEGHTVKARLIVKDHGVICGVDLAGKIFHQVDPSLLIEIFLKDGDSVVPGQVAFTVTGNPASILRSERLVLNFMQRLSGIATATRRAVSLLRGLPTRVLDTRKTTPLLRELEKYAVRTGGGENHRMGLYDMIMIKDNHVDYAGGIIQAIEATQRYLDKTGKDLKVEIEVRNFSELQEVLDHGGVDRIMLDNFTVEDLAEAVRRIGGRFETEASGGITPETLRTYAETGVDFISMGALTHHIQSLDLSLKAG